MKQHLPFALATIFLIVAGCSTSKRETTEWPYSSIKTQTLIEMVDSSTNADGWSGPEWFDYAARLDELQKRADIVFQAESVNFESVKIIKTKVIGNITNVEFPISDLSKHFPPGGTGRQLTLVIFYAPWDAAFVIEPGKPDPDEVMRNIINVMYQYGVKRVMFQSLYHGLLVEDIQNLNK